jgi:hypothetical protein
MSFLFIASPYSAPVASVVARRVEETMRFSGWLFRKGIWNFSPIVHNHEIAKKEEFRTDASFWGHYSTAMIRASGGVIVLRLGGWNVSVGVKFEIQQAKLLGKRVEYALPVGREYLISEIPDAGSGHINPEAKSTVPSGGEGPGL